MNKAVKFSLLIVGLVLIGYGVYALISPEASTALESVTIETQDNNDAYITLVLGLVAVVLSVVGGKTYK